MQQGRRAILPTYYTKEAISLINKIY